MAFDTLSIEHHGKVGVIKLDRPDALNAINRQLIEELGTALKQQDQDDHVGCIIITGSEKAFAAGADVKEMQSYSYIEATKEDFLSPWDEVPKTRKPVIAAVCGYALGGGCELAMMCDFIICSDTAKFGQPEITLGIMPGVGGTQRLTRLIGKAKAMEMCLTGRTMSAQEAESVGLVSRVVPANELMDTALKTAEKIAEFSKPIVAMTKATVNRAYETTLAEGLRYERQTFYSMFSTDDQKEGMQAFIDKRSAKFRDH
ncbi:MAG: enoyl-CoA hydratase [Pseudomonadota bacterium]